MSGPDRLFRLLPFVDPPRAERISPAAGGSIGTPLLDRDRHLTVRGWPWVRHLGRDVRHAARGLGRSPGFATLVVAVLGLGIGTSTAVFSLIHSVLLSPLPFREPDQLVTAQIHIREMEDRFPALPASLLALEAWDECRDTCAGVAAVRPRTSVLTDSGEPRRLPGAEVTVNFFDLLGSGPMIGRGFRRADATVDGPGVAVLTHDFWQAAFGGDPLAIGRTLTLDDERVEVIGVLPDTFWLPSLDRLVPLTGAEADPVEIFRPLRYTPEAAGRFGEFDYPALLRLTPGATAEQATTELTALTREAFRAFPFTITPLVRPLDLQIAGDFRAPLGWLMAAVAALLLVACVNVASLLAARGLGRRHELAVRGALGGGTADLVRHALAESAVLAGLGGVVGVGVAYAGLRISDLAAPLQVPRLDEASVDGLALAVAAGAATVCAVACGLPSAWRAGRTSPAAVLKAGVDAGSDRPWHRLGDLLVSLQVTVTVVLLATGGLLLSSFVRVMAVDRGFEPASVVAVDLILPASRYDADSRTQFYDDLLARLSDAPGVASAGLTQTLPLEGESFVELLVPEDQVAADPVELAPLVGNYRFVSPDYFETLGMVLARGRSFTGEDRARPVAIVTAETAARLWPDQDPVGQRFVRGASPDRPPQEVVGVVVDARILGLDVDPGLVAYLPYWENAMPSVTVVTRSADESGTVVASVRDAVRGIDPLLPASNMRMLSDVLAESVAVRRFLLQVTAGFAVAGLVLIGVGIFGVVSERTLRRRHEFAVRWALGAPRGRIVRQVCVQGLRPVAIGLAAGLVGSFAAGQFIRGLLFEVDPLEFAVLACASLTVLGLGAAACLVPASRTLRVPPAHTLQAQ